MTPNLFIVGFQKCGSSTLFDLLRQHPSIVGSVPKETFALVDSMYQHYNAEINVMTQQFSWSPYFELSKPSVRYYVEGSVCNFYQKRALSYIAGLNDKKVIFIVRDPIKRLISNYEYFTARENKLLSITDYIRLLRNQDDSHTWEFEGSKFGLSHGKYVTYIRDWEDQIGKENILILSFEDLIKNTRDVLNKVFVFLRLEDYSDFQLPHTNASKVVRNRNLHFVLKRYVGRYRPGRIPFFRILYQKINIRGPKKATLKPKDIEWLRHYYEEEYRFLERMSQD